jgi:transcriptional regulator with XRE-family HTH domain
LKIKEAAEAKGFNMSSLSRRSDISFSTIKRIWRDPYKSVGTEMLGKIASALGVSVYDLIEEVPDTPPEKN